MRVVVATAARHRPLLIAAVPMLNHGSTTCSMVVAPSPSGLMRSPLPIATSSVTGDDSLPRSPSPSKAPATVTPGASRRTRNTVDSSGDAAPGRCALAT
jgi:hypothetical protein